MQKKKAKLKSQGSEHKSVINEVNLNERPIASKIVAMLALQENENKS